MVGQAQLFGRTAMHGMAVYAWPDRLCMAKTTGDIMTSDWLTKNHERLSEYVRMSVSAGSRPDYVQGGGGNTSCKLDDRQMAIKASGFRLDQIRADQAYAVLDYRQLRDFYSQNDPSVMTDVEQTGSAQAKAAIINIDGLPQLRPSVEAGFHSLLDTLFPILIRVHS